MQANSISATLALTLISVMLSSAATAARIDLTDRQVPLTVTSDNLVSTTLGSSPAPAGTSLQAAFPLTEEQARGTYALLIPTTASTTVTLNGSNILLRPAARTDSVVYPLFPTALQAGQNQLQIEQATSGSWEGTVIFSLKDGFEEAHFPFSEASSAPGVSTRDISPSAQQETYDVQWYDCTWIPRVGSAYLETGSQVLMSAKALAPITSIQVDFDLGGYSGYNGSMTIDSVDSGAGTSALPWSNLPNADSPRMSIQLPRTYAAGEQFQVRIAYHGAPNPTFPKSIFGTRPAFTSRIDSGGVMIYSESQPYGGRRWWPSKDHPSDKATTSIQRIIVPNNTGSPLTAVSNGTLAQTINHGATTEFVWENSYPIATYLVSLAISNYEYYGGQYTALDGVTKMPVGAYIRPANRSTEMDGYIGTLEVMNFFADTFGEYPFLSEKYVTAAWGDTFGIEHQTCTSMPAGGLGDGRARRNVHELCHQWFGDKLTYHNLDHVWLGEGFATYAEALYTEHVSGYSAFRANVQSWNGNGPVVGPDADLYNNNNQYARAARVLDMLRFYLGDTTFFQALKHYAATGYTTAVSQPGDDPDAGVDFQSAMEQGAGLAPGSLQQFFDQWLYSGGSSSTYASRPIYSYSASYDILTSSVTVRLKQTQTGSQFQMPVPFRLTGVDNSTRDVVVPVGSTEATFPLGPFTPATISLDPDTWLLRTNGLRFNDVTIPSATAGSPYSQLISTSTNTGTRTFQKLADTPTWLSISSPGILSGTPPAPGLYPVNLRVSTSAGFIDVNYQLIVVAGTPEPPTPPVVINELSYESRSGSPTDGEFVELRNNSNSSVNISGWKLQLVSSSGSAYATVTIPASTVLASGAYYVIGNAAAINAVYPGAVNLNTNWDSDLTDNGPASVILETGAGARVDSVTYRADGTVGSGPFSTQMLAEGGTGRAISYGIANTSSNATLGRLPNGADSNQNLQDFTIIPPSPGSANIGISLPFFDDFNTGPRPQWRPSFTAPVRTASPGSTGKPPVAAPAPAGGNFLEVYDPTGGGDVVMLPGAYNKLNVEGYIWIPQDQATQAWSTGIGINTRVESSWFGSSSGFALPNGFYLEYQNGPNVNLSGPRISNSPGQARFFAANSSSVPGVGLSAMSVTNLGQPATPPPAGWQSFRLVYDRPANRLYASIGNSVIYDGAIPPGGYNLSGGICVGFRENHSGNIFSENTEGTWIDNLTVNTDTTINSRVEDYNLY